MESCLRTPCLLFISQTSGWTNPLQAVLSLFALVYLILSSGISRAFRVLPWWIFIQLGLDALFFIFWIAAAGTSHLNCQDLCSACDAWGGTVYLDSLYCTCYSSYDVIYKKRNLSPNPNPGLSAGLQKRRSRYSSAGRATGTLVAREALDAILVYVSLSISSRRHFFSCFFPFNVQDYFIRTHSWHLPPKKSILR